MFSSLQIGYVCELYLELGIVRIARFCSLGSLVLSCSQSIKPLLKCGSIEVLYKV